MVKMIEVKDFQKRNKGFFMGGRFLCDNPVKITDISKIGFLD